MSFTTYIFHVILSEQCN